MSIYTKLNQIQQELVAPKNQYSKFGDFWYRSCEDILEAVKPICRKHNTTLVLIDKPALIGDWHYIESTALLIDNDVENSQIAITAYAREPKEKTKMDLMQITGATISYARKYALNGLFCIDDSKDADTNEFQKQTQETKPTTKTEESTISTKIVESLRLAIKNANKTNDEVLNALKQLKHNKLAEIKVSELAKFREILGVKE